MNKLIVWTVLAAACFSGCSSVHQMNPTPEQQSGAKISISEDDFNKERAIQEAYDKGFKEGIKKGTDQTISIITKEYLPYIKRLEAGKYAVRKGYITPPEIMVFQGTDGTLSYRATGCKIEKELDVADIFKKFGSSVVVSSEKATKTEYKDAESAVDDESYQISPRDHISTSVLRPWNQSEVITKVITKTSSNKLVLDEYNVQYSEKEGDYIASFTTQEEMEGFCGQFRICSKD